MKKLLLMLAVSAFVSTAVMAQDQKVKQDKTEWENKVKTELNLNADQTAKWDALGKEYNAKFEILANDNTLSKEAQKEKKMALKKEKEGKLAEFLTPEQMTKYRDIMEKKKAAKPAGS